MKVSHNHSAENSQYEHSHEGGDHTHWEGSDGYLGYWRTNENGALEFVRPTGIVADPQPEQPESEEKRAGDPRFHAVLKEMGDTHDRKQQDYGTDGDPFANLRASADFGVRPWVGAYVRLNDKITRVKSFIRKGTLANESIEDSLLDIATYAAIALVLYREDPKK